jgi:AsmA protein
VKRALAILAGVVVALILVLAGLGVFLLSRIDLKARAIAAIEQATGRNVEIRGPVGITLFPTLGVKASQVSVGNAPGGRAANMVDARDVTIGVAAMPLFKRDLQVTALKLVDPVISLEILPNGAPNWVLQVTPIANAPGGVKVDTRIETVKLNGVSIANGRLEFYNAATHSAFALDKVDADIELAGLDKPLSLKGSGVYEGERAEIGLSLSTPKELLANKPMGLAMNITSAPVNLRFEGKLEPGTSGLNGALEASGPDLRRLAAWGGHPIGEGAGLKNFAVKGNFIYANHATAFNNASITLDAISGRGDVLIETSRAKPLISGRLELAGLDLNPYLARVSAQTSAAASIAPPTAIVPSSTAPPRASGLQPIDVTKAGYDATPLDYSGLRNFNANVDLLIKGVLQVQKLRIDHTRLSIVLNEGFLASSLSEMELYGGKGVGHVRIDARGTPLRFSETLDVENVRALGFFGDALGLTALDAPANVSLTLETEGLNQQELISKLHGDGAFYFDKGAFKGIDFGGLTRTVKNLLSGKITGPNAQTPFDHFAATLRIERGVAAFRDFKLDGPRVQVLGQGSINMGAQTLDLRFSPRTVFKRDETGKAKSSGIPLPFRASGPWTQLKFTTDISGKGKREQEREICVVTRDC